MVPVDGVGRVDVDAMGDVVGDDTGIVHCQWGNHEVGTLQPVGAVVAAVDGRAPVHSDAAAAVGHVPISFVESGVDLMSVSAHKFGGPTGSGALLVRRGLRVDPLLVGGDQERARRAGMEDVAAVVGFAAGLEAAVAAMDAESARSRDLTDRVIEWAATFEGVAVVGDPADRLPHIVCLTIDGIEPQPVLLGLDQAGVAVHSGSSCSSESIEPSPVLEAMGVDAQRSLRVSVGWSSTDEDIDRLLDVLPRTIGELRSLRG
jgi:cysteine desulfurase